MNKRRQILKAKILRLISTYTAIAILIEIVSPTVAFALTSGPSQPEVQSFEPVGTSEMVDLFTGDFKYNIPLLEVDGYPINIAYHSGITMDQEASWVGLGWNINPGAINRAMRGIPDDFNGDLIEKKLNFKPNITYGLSAGAGAEFWGFGGLGYSIGMNYNNYTGVGIEQSINLSIGGSVSGGKGGASVCAGLGMNSSSEDGLSLQPSLGISASLKEAEGEGTVAGLGSSVSLSYNSRAGLKSLTIGGSFSSDRKLAGVLPLGIGASTTYNLMAPTYTPTAPFPMENEMITGNFTIGGLVFGLHPHGAVGGYRTEQKLATKYRKNPAFGYMCTENGQYNGNAIFDFNREKEGTFFRNTPNLPVTNYTYDIFSVSGQGTGGSYRAFRSEMGTVADPSNYTTSSGYSIGAEVGLGNIAHVGGDFIENSSFSSSGQWTEGNLAIPFLRNKSAGDDPLYEPYYFKEANELSVDSDPGFFDMQGGVAAYSVEINQMAPFFTIAKPNLTGANNVSLINKNQRSNRVARNQSITVLNRNQINSGIGLQNYSVSADLYQSTTYGIGHHIAEVTSLNKDGSRYVYGIAAYNINQQEVSFATGATSQDATDQINADLKKGLIPYTAGVDNDVDNNKHGLDNFYSNTILPPYAHSYLLTAILSPDYVDSENGTPQLIGPSDGDIGNYTKFEYERIQNYNWRVPFEKDKANFNEGLRSLKYDDKGSYIYGIKDLYFLKKIETKNYVAIFTTEARDDGYGVINENGGLDQNSNKSSRLLRKISLYTKKEYNKIGGNPMPIKEVHFEYDYSLCKNVPNNKNTSGNNGKLTLKQIYFTYQNSKKARFSPYKFSYNEQNPDYDIKGYDRWGNYKPNPMANFVGAIASHAAQSQTTNPLSNAEYPYAEQDPTKANDYAQAWTLNQIELPSGGVIKVEYEADDYAYVQNKKAMQMFQFVGIDNDGAGLTGNMQTGFTSVDLNAGRANDWEDIKLIVKLDQAVNEATFKKNYIDGIGPMYYRFLMKMRNDKYEYVSGYIPPDGIESYGIYGGTSEYAWINIESRHINDTDGEEVAPMTKAATQFGRLNLSKIVWDASDVDGQIQENSTLGENVLQALVNSNFFKNIPDARKGANYALYAHHDVGHEAITNKSWVRLFNGNGFKKGGGLRVKRVILEDSWQKMAKNLDGTESEAASTYGQEYSYESEGISTGVAAYEPLIGGEENPWKIPVDYSYEKKWAPDDLLYLEEPFGESFFPSPTVGYSLVTVKSIHNEPNDHPTGEVMHEFYTAKDFPTVPRRTEISTQPEVDKPTSLSKLLKINVKEYLTASQGYLVELNDMHGKPKKQTSFSANNEIVSSIQYVYKTLPENSSNLNNSVVAIDSKGYSRNATIGIFSDFISDFGEQKTFSESGGVETNLDIVLYGIYPIPQPMVKPNYASEGTQFHSAVITKVIQRSGLLTETIVNENGSITSTKNLAYDAETGNVLLTKTITNFDDSIYSLKFPAYWKYDGMGPAYRNVGLTRILDFDPSNNGVANVNLAPFLYSEGDEISLSASATKAWITEVNPTSIKAVTWSGVPVNSTQSGLTKVIRSGRRNQQDLTMASITTMENPLNGIGTNVYSNVLQAAAIEYSNSWRTFCDCFTQKDNNSQSNSLNPFILGTKGTWKVKRSFTHLTGRKQSNYNSNTNIRKDGVFTSFSPFYRFNGNKWEVDGHDWTFASEVTEFSPFGNEIENRDAIGNYSSSIYGYNQSLPLAVASNAKSNEIAFDNFEDYDFSLCADNHFKFKNPINNLIYDPGLIAKEGHTGRHAALVHADSQVSITKEIQPCPIVVCDMELEVSESQDDDLTTIKSVHIIKGKNPFTIDYTVISGSPFINITNDRTITVKGNDPYEIEIKVVDSNGCLLLTNVKL